MRLTVPLHIPIAPELKDRIDQAAFDLGLPTNEYVAKILAEHLGLPELAKIPRKALGRPRARVAQK
jgi:hypothetical protein